MTRVVKLGGSTLANGEWLSSFASAVAASPSGLVVVHGGGPDVTELSERLGLEVRWSGGRRVTTPESLDVVVMVLSGRTNKRLVRELAAAGVDAFGLSGEDGGLLRARVVEDGRLGRVGEVVEVRVELLNRLIDSGHVPVVSPISLGEDGGALNVNADDAASAVAAAAGASELLFVTNVPGVLLDDGTRLEVLGASRAAELLEDGTARDGMSVKVRAALRAIEIGVPRVRIGPVEMLFDPNTGTTIRADAEVVA
ncbi:MAG TPA: acetylglutamate kinase [Longimicrobiales bacterium]|nr:acetylglutamate kinase [Longimicrobiales bacterium]